MIRSDWVKYLRKLSLKELRRRQSLTNQQIQVAFKAKKSRALSVLQVMSSSLIVAIHLNEF